MLTKKEFIKNKTNAYIKSPEDKNIYIKIIYKLIELGFHTYDNKTPEDFFKNDYIVIYWNNPGGDMHPRINPDGGTEIQISDILGEDWIIGSANIRHPNGTWAEIVSMPDTKKLKLEVGKWYTYIERPNSLICCQNAFEERGYGIWIEGWDSSPTTYSIGTTSKWRELSDKEVEERLLKYAKEHYPVGTEFKSALMNGNSTYTVESTSYFMWHGLDGVVVNDPIGASIYHEGKWAEIISKPEVKFEQPPCKVGDYLYIIDATKDGENPHKEAYSGDIVEITDIYKEKDSSKYGGWWVSHKPASFSGGGFRLGGNGYQWNKHIRLATGDEIMPKLSQDYPLPYEQAVQTDRGILGAFKEKPKLKLKSNNKKVIISKKHVQVSNKHLI